MYVDVLIEINHKSINQVYTYHVPNDIKECFVGARVLVPFGRQNLEGFIMKVYKNYDNKYKLKDVIKLIDKTPVLNEELLDLGKYISKKTLTNLILCYQTMLPSALKAHVNNKTNLKTVTYIRLIDSSYLPKNNNQDTIINLLKEKDRLKSELAKISASSVNTLKSKKVIEEYLKEEYRLVHSDEKENEKIKLTEEQKEVITECKKNINSFTPYLLHGVTGSGKTEVYMQLINEVLNNKKTALVLVPEISLTPIIIQRFQKRFGNEIAILHSGLSNGEKFDEWRKIVNGEVKIVIGARSAAFAPLKNLGIIIVDEEHSDSYKQENNPKYDAKDVLLYRARKHKCPIIFGSATPLIESFTRAKLGIYKLLTMKKRVNNKLPEVSLIDMQDEIKKGRRIISLKLKNELEKTISKKEQAIILLNRRGYSTIITCQDCGYKECCPNCDIPLTYHKKNNILKCHYCNLTKPLLNICPECGSNNINEFGLGTEKLEAELAKISEDFKVIRMDQDTTTKKGSHSKIIEDFKNNKYNILIGTQMIAKGLDFENVTLVGVINGDQTLNIPDFRSAFKTYALLSQVAGRAGRSKKEGKVIIQGFNLDHYSINFAKNHDYHSFYDEEIKIRKKLEYPPFTNLSLIKIISTNYDECLKNANLIKNYLLRGKNDYVVLGPTASIVPKVNNKYYFQVIIKYKNSLSIFPKLEFIKEKYKTNNRIQIDIDINPIKL